MIQLVTQEEINASKELRVVEVTTKTCNYCKMLEPHLEAATQEAGIKVFKLDAEENEDFAKKYDIVKAPTVLVFNPKGDLLASFFGFKPKEAIDEFLKGVK